MIETKRWGGATLLAAYDPARLTHVVANVDAALFAQKTGGVRPCDVPAALPVLRWDWVKTGEQPEGVARWQEYATYADHVVVGPEAPAVERPAAHAAAEEHTRTPVAKPAAVAPQRDTDSSDEEASRISWVAALSMAVPRLTLSDRTGSSRRTAASREPNRRARRRRPPRPSPRCVAARARQQTPSPSSTPPRGPSGRQRCVAAVACCCREARRHAPLLCAAAPGHAAASWARRGRGWKRAKRGERAQGLLRGGREMLKGSCRLSSAI